MRLVAAFMLTIIMAMGAAVFAAEPAPPPKPGAPTDATPAKEPPPAAAKPDETDTAAAAKGSSNTAASPQRFIPSEQVRADFDVSFPIDI